MSKLKRIKKLIDVYGTSDTEELITAMRSDIKYILRRQKHEDSRNDKSELGYSRVSSDRWNR